MNNIVFTGRPIFAQDNAMVGLFRLDPDGSTASRVQVRLGRVSANAVEVVQGLQPGDRVILSELQLPDNTQTVRINAAFHPGSPRYTD